LSENEIMQDGENLLQEKKFVSQVPTGEKLQEKKQLNKHANKKYLK